MASIAKMSYDEESISLATLLATKSMGYLELRPLQEQVVTHSVGGRDVVVSFSTGGGKSLCYAILPLVVPAFFSARKIDTRLFGRPFNWRTSSS